MTCVACGTPNPAGKKFCSKCGARLVAAAAPPPPPPVPPPAPASSSAGSVQASLSRLGVPVSTRQVIGIVAGMAAGMVTARSLPYLYSGFFGGVLNQVFGGGGSGTSRDAFNASSMTFITFGASFGISFLLSRKWRRA